MVYGLWHVVLTKRKCAENVRLRSKWVNYSIYHVVISLCWHAENMGLRSKWNKHSLCSVDHVG